MFLLADARGILRSPPGIILHLYPPPCVTVITSDEQRGIRSLVSSHEGDGAGVFPGEPLDGERVIPSRIHLDLIKVVRVQLGLIEVPFHLDEVARADATPEHGCVPLQTLYIL